MNTVRRKNSRASSLQNCICCGVAARRYSPQHRYRSRFYVVFHEIMSKLIILYLFRYFFLRFWSMKYYQIVFWLGFGKNVFFEKPAGRFFQIFWAFFFSQKKEFKFFYGNYWKQCKNQRLTKIYVLCLSIAFFKIIDRIH